MAKKKFKYLYFKNGEKEPVLDCKRLDNLYGTAYQFSTSSGTYKVQLGFVCSFFEAFAEDGVIKWKIRHDIERVE